jgi:ATP citrate (pro-S)-lyase
MKEAFQKYQDVTVMINFASFRSVYDSVMEALDYAGRLKTIAIIAEGVPESQTRALIKAAAEKGVGIIGPATVGGIKPGCFRIGNTGGMLDNIVMSKLYRPGSVAYVSRSGGMSNELNNIIAQNSDGVYEGIAIGGDRYPGSRFLDHILRYNNNPSVKILVLLGEVGGVDEYDICEALNGGLITKPLIAWCIGTCANLFTFEVQFGHAGACARGNLETALAKNKALREAGAIVPNSFFEFGDAIYKTYTKLVEDGILVPAPEPPVPKVILPANCNANNGINRLLKCIFSLFFHFGRCLWILLGQKS